MYVAVLQAKHSPDPDTKVGACIVSKSETVFFGINSIGGMLPSSELYKNKELKKLCITHAEINAIKAFYSYNEDNPFTEVDIGDMYITHPPCSECLEAIKLFGIKRIVVLRAQEQTKQGQIKWDAILDNAANFCEKNGIAFSILNNSYFKGV